MGNYLLEIGTEEIPAKFMPGVLQQMKDITEKQLKERRIEYGTIDVFGTPRRLALIINNIADKEEDLKEEVRGPSKKAAFDPAGNPTKAAQGFARSQGVDVNDLTIKDTGNGEYIYALKEIEGKVVKEILPQFSLSLINGLNFPKPMRWGSLEMRFARPIRWIISLLDNEVIDFEVAGVKAGNISRGHRFLGSEEIKIQLVTDYIKQMESNFVMVDQEKRLSECWKQIEDVAKEVSGIVEEDEELLEEVTYLLEWPTALMGSFEEDYLKMPKEVIITPMREHQRYFPVKDQDGKLLNRFITVRNGNDKHLDIVRSGNEKVLKARLADARFFWEEDQKIKLEEFLPRLEKVVFQESLGTISKKIERIINNTRWIGNKLSLSYNEIQDALRAAKLAKADLVTNMVYEFPELQGIMGRYYALISGESKQVAQAIKEHYQPRFAGDDLPESYEGALVSIADKMDTIAGCFAIGIEPTGSQDPYALRRQAMGICQILAGFNMEIDLDELIQRALENYRGIVEDKALEGEVKMKIKEFFLARVKNLLSDEGHRYDVIDSILGVNTDYVVAALKRARALSDMKSDVEFQKLITSFTRAYNLAKKAEEAKIQPDFLKEDAEKKLYQAILDIEVDVQELAENRDYQAVIKKLSILTEPINEFFEAVMVMDKDENIRKNRLGLLNKIVVLTSYVGDLSKLV